jgi:hypothetical protein
MNDRPKIVVGLAVVLAALTFPFWYALAGGRSGAPPDLELPAGQTHCVEDRQYMRAHHMELLDQWRTAVVREGKQTYVSKAFGQSYEMSLTKTCMGCHTSREAFCTKCHSYMNVQASQTLQPFAPGRPSRQGIYCWDCHVAPEEK